MPADEFDLLKAFITIDAKKAQSSIKSLKKEVASLQKQITNLQKQLDKGLKVTISSDLKNAANNISALSAGAGRAAKNLNRAKREAQELRRELVAVGGVRGGGTSISSPRSRRGALVPSGGGALVPTGGGALIPIGASRAIISRNRDLIISDSMFPVGFARRLRLPPPDRIKLSRFRDEIIDAFVVGRGPSLRQTAIPPPFDPRFTRGTGFTGSFGQRLLPPPRPTFPFGANTGLGPTALLTRFFPRDGFRQAFRETFQRFAGSGVGRFARSGIEAVGNRRGLQNFRGITLPALAGGFAIANTAQDTVQLASAIERTTFALGKLTKSRPELDSLFNSLKQLARDTTTDFTELLPSAQKLLGSGFQSGAVTPLLSQLADLSIITSANGVSFQRLVDVVARNNLQFRVLTRDVREFTNAGLNILPSLQRQLGAVDFEEVFDRIRKGEVTINNLLQAITDLTSQGGIAFRLQAEAAGTAFLAFDKLREEVNLLKNDIGQGLLPALAEAARIAANLLRDTRGEIRISQTTGQPETPGQRRLREEQAGNESFIAGVKGLFVDVFTPLSNLGKGLSALAAEIPAARARELQAEAVALRRRLFFDEKLTAEQIARDRRVLDLEQKIRVQQERAAAFRFAAQKVTEPVGPSAQLRARDAERTARALAEAERLRRLRGFSAETFGFNQATSNIISANDLTPAGQVLALAFITEVNRLSSRIRPFQQSIAGAIAEGIRTARIAVGGAQVSAVGFLGGLLQDPKILTDKIGDLERELEGLKKPRTVRERERRAAIQGELPALRERRFNIIADQARASNIQAFNSTFQTVGALIARAEVALGGGAIGLGTIFAAANSDYTKAAEKMLQAANKFVIAAAAANNAAPNVVIPADAFQGPED